MTRREGEGFYCLFEGDRVTCEAKTTVKTKNECEMSPMKASIDEDDRAGKILLK